MLKVLCRWSAKVSLTLEDARQREERDQSSGVQRWRPALTPAVAAGFCGTWGVTWGRSQSTGQRPAGPRAPSKRSRAPSSTSEREALTGAPFGGAPLRGSHCSDQGKTVDKG